MQMMSEKYVWTNHARMKMRHYRLTESRVKRIIRHPSRIEEGVLENGIACMQPDGQPMKEKEPPSQWQKKRASEIWVMYVIVKSKSKPQIKIITAWRYPGKSPERDPIPADVLREVKQIIF